MARGRHQKDKLYLIHGELSCSAKPSTEDRRVAVVPFDYCKLRLKPFDPAEQVLSDKSGYFFEKEELLAWLSDYGKNPVTGEAASQRDFFTVQITRDEQGNPCCPVTGKRYGMGDSYLVNKRNGNLYCDSVISELCRKTGCWVDPVDGTDMKLKKDLVKLPQDTFGVLEERQNLVKKKGRRKGNSSAAEPTPDGPVEKNSRTLGTGRERSGLAKRVLSELENSTENYGEKLAKLLRRPGDGGREGYLDPISGELKKVKSRLFSTGIAAQSVTSTLVSSEGSNQSMQTMTSREYRSLWYDCVRRSKKNLYITFDTMIDESLRCVFYAHKTPENSHQVLINATKNYYTIFHPVTFNQSPALLLTEHTEHFDDIEEELTKLEKPNNHIRAGTILLWKEHDHLISQSDVSKSFLMKQRVSSDSPIRSGLLFTTRGCLVDDEMHLTILGCCGDVPTLEKIARKISKGKASGGEAVSKKEASSCGLRGACIHENPFVGAEKQAISTCL
ncbi:putative peptidylprolyl isomerase [Gregarina niphandrodes]|uniref:Peptidylprolyl isomerase n=1 Tax=Gregarina niphandrodes TaxID=110365 RepID=A0A023BDM3_GRENI|nr:putative peptidylprolyl isomerase [Gregarina niphandrodes]EZG89642.1 putative peptidylprolyl isomerase [Gregarina niphandrodes]|eukprot:XP_011128476.1 putative peptidylprolyl isomerase [Gregarina niphandrodes]